MFTPMFHGQNRLSNTIIHPDDIPNYINHTVWINNEDSNIIRYGGTPDYVSYYKNIANMTENLSAIGYNNGGRPRINESNANFNNNRTSAFITQLANATGINIQTSNATPVLTPSFYEINGFIVFDYDTAYLEPTVVWKFDNSNGVYHWIDNESRTWAIAMNVYGIHIVRKVDNDIVSLGSAPHANQGYNKVIISFTQRSVSVNGITVIDINSSYPVDANSCVSNSGIGVRIFGGFDEPEIMTLPYASIAEAIIYGLHMDSDQINGIINYLNDRHKIF